jgi:hypothetical protein
MPGSSLAIHAADEVYRLASWNDVVLIDWHAEPTRERLQHFENVVRAVAHQEMKVTLLVRLRPNLGLPSTEVRSEITRVIRELASVTRGWAVLLEGDGFWAATHRSLSATMHLLSGSPSKMRFFKTDRAAATFVVHLCGRHHPLDIMRLLDDANRIAIPA